MTSSAHGLHPIAAPLATAEIRFELRGALRGGASGALECVYRPRRERDVKRSRHFHLFDFPGRIGSRDRLTVQREEFHSVRRELRATDGAVRFTVPLRDPDPAYAAYQLAEVRVEEFAFARWFEDTPALDPAFGLAAAADALGGRASLDGLGADPLRGDLPLWPALRRVSLEIVRDRRPVVQLWDPSQKHHWDGWRQATPDHWPGGRTIVARHVAAPTVWRAHEYFAFPPANEPPIERPEPPADVLPGVALEAFWPEGGMLEFPEVRFERPAAVVALRLANLTPRAQALLAESARLRPGTAPGSLAAAEWDELDALAAAAPLPVEFEMQPAAEGRSRLVLHRRELTEPWLFLFAVEYDSERRYAVTSLVLHPGAWTGPMPE